MTKAEKEARKAYEQELVRAGVDKGRKARRNPYF